MIEIEIFYEQRRIATEIKLIEVSLSQFGKPDNFLRSLVSRATIMSLINTSSDAYAWLTLLLTEDILNNNPSVI